MKRVIQLESTDNVAVATFDLIKGDKVTTGNGITFVVTEDIPLGHKIAMEDITSKEHIIKYGASIGHAVEDIPLGSWAHTHNMETNLRGKEEYTYNPISRIINEYDFPVPSINVHKRKNGTVGIRNELWVIPTVGCVNGVAANIVREFLSRSKREKVDGVYAFSHPYGCSQLGGDHERTKHILQNFAVHPNAGGVLVIGLGCENNQIKTFRATMPEGWDEERIVFLEAQSVGDEIEAALTILEDLYQKAALDKRVPGSISDLVIGLECGGSDAFSGITANPLIGLLSDFVVSRGGSTMLTEVPEMFGAEHILMEQCDSIETFNKTVAMVNDFKEYYQSHDQPVYENPSPGNKKGGISTLEDKSLGCTKKAGNSKVVDVLMNDQIIKKKGLNLLSAPGNDIVATTVLGAAGCQFVLFSTGRGTPLGGFIPTFKIATNTELARKKPHWIDFDAGQILEHDISREDLLKNLLEKIIAVVNGELVKAELNHYRDVALFKTGVTL